MFPAKIRFPMNNLMDLNYYFCVHFIMCLIKNYNTAIKSDSWKETLEKTKGATRNGQSRDTR